MRRNRLTPFRYWVFGAGIFNAVAGFPLAAPFLSKHYIVLLNDLNTLSGLGGKELKPPDDGAMMLIVNMAGLAVLLIGLMLIYASADLEKRRGIPLLNGICRLIFSILVVYYVATEDIARMLLGVAMIDFVIGGVFLYYLFELRHSWASPDQ